MDKRLGVLLVTSVFIVGCAGSPAALSQMTKDELGKVPDKQLIRAIANDVYQTEAMLFEANERGLLTKREMRLVRESRIQIGMSETALIASLGYPSDINRSVGEYGVHKQYVYDDGSTYSDPVYVYVEDGRITSWQD